jgi:HEAT repeat protein
LRNNAAISLRFYPEAREVVAPALEAALSDGEPHVRLLVAEALNRVDPQRARKAGVTALVAEIARAQGDQIASRAVRALTSKGSDPITALPALTEALRSTNTLVSSSAVWALQRAPSEFVEYAPLIVTALVTAAERDDATGRYAKVALKEWKSRADGGSAPESR